MSVFAIVSALYPPHVGGVERYSYNLAKKLEERGHKIIVITSGIGEVEVVSEKMKIYRMPSWHLLNGRLPVSKRTKGFVKLENDLKEERIEAFIINTRFYPLSLWAARFSKKIDAQAVLVEHGSSHLTFNNHFLDVFVQIYEHGITWLIKHYRIKYYGVSMDACKWLDHFGIRAEGTLYNAMDMDEIHELEKKVPENFREELGLEKSDFVVTYIGRVIGAKGILELNEAVGKLCQHYPETKLVIAGEGSLMETLKAQKSVNTLLLGKISYNKVIALLKNADVFCLASESEGFPTSVLEAVACKCFVVTTRAGGSKELITGKEYGIILKDNSPESIYQALEILIKDREYRIKAAENCYERLNEKFTWNRIAQKVERILCTENKK